MNPQTCVRKKNHKRMFKNEKRRKWEEEKSTEEPNPGFVASKTPPIFPWILSSCYTLTPGEGSSTSHPTSLPHDPAPHAAPGHPRLRTCNSSSALQAGSFPSLPCPRGPPCGGVCADPSGHGWLCADAVVRHGPSSPTCGHHHPCGHGGRRRPDGHDGHRHPYGRLWILTAHHASRLATVTANAHGGAWSCGESGGGSCVCGVCVRM